MTSHQTVAAQLAISQAKIDALVSETHSLALQNLHSAQELSIQRHSLADELSYLTQELVSSMSDEEKKSTLLEDIETLHRSLKELQSVKGYVQVIEHSLKLRYAYLHCDLYDPINDHCYAVNLQSNRYGAPMSQLSHQVLSQNTSLCKNSSQKCLNLAPKSKMPLDNKICS